ncbi:MAG: beta-ketoacyl-[acyl-carrier-protein] synthase family protein [Chitinispirillales bacterium]|jgi:3-oxoacyl-[acyl-carrier-protein] synthase-1|nr:beta-ketoacyl-[acyl-carrier-protein] synthase family protein [Chitinispirillales bacterium]
MGIPVVSAFSFSSAKNIDDLFDGKSFIDVQNEFLDKDANKMLCGRVSCFGKSDNFSKTEEFADKTIETLLKTAGISLKNFSDYNPFLLVGTTVGGVDRTEKEYLKVRNGNEINLKNFERHGADSMTKFLAQKYGFRRFLAISTACSSGLHAIGLAKKIVESKKSDLVVAVGADALCELTTKGFESLMLVDKNACRPFDKNRAGISLGEGGGAVILCSENFAKTTNIAPLSSDRVFIAGYGSSCDAYHATAPNPNGEGAVSAIKKAIEDANISPNDIDWICSHGTGTIDNDLAEIKAYRAVFSEKIPPFCSFKGAIGHTLAASGAIETAYVIEAMKREIIPVTAGFHQIDESIGVSPTIRKLSKKAKFVLKTAFGFGGNNAAVVIKMR